ncbi:hypothetical protein EFR84_02705 [Rhizobium chutanense]|uniref:Uncharacterized protein n=1 Tax=Rhizobium chutanense TaxID=2035448 RepID=A0A432P8S9_9HYPH|nr:hypothetical protein [Rhizobium chutanense]RUM09271.1 hypothetical protein EFR84_02705 [Rhizobium chutanense]
MTVNFVPRDLFIQHENEWRALREATGERIDIGNHAKPLVPSIGRPVSVGKNEAPAARSE